MNLFLVIFHLLRKLKGHQDRKNYSVIGPGVSEDAKQNVKIAEEHGFNIGAAGQPPRCRNSLHSHRTAEVFFCTIRSLEVLSWGSSGEKLEKWF